MGVGERLRRVVADERDALREAGVLGADLENVLVVPNSAVIKQGGGTDSYKGWFVRLKYAFLQYDYMKPNADGASAFASTRSRPAC